MPESSEGAATVGYGEKGGVEYGVNGAGDGYSVHSSRAFGVAIQE